MNKHLNSILILILAVVLIVMTLQNLRLKKDLKSSQDQIKSLNLEMTEIANAVCQ